MSEIEYLLKEYTDRIAYLTSGLAQGNIPTIEEYRYVCGQIRGIEAACGIIEDLERRKQKEENSDNE
jgi:hypothetical protein